MRKKKNLKKSGKEKKRVRKKCELVPVYQRSNAKFCWTGRDSNEGTWVETGGGKPVPNDPVRTTHGDKEALADQKVKKGKRRIEQERGAGKKIVKSKDPPIRQGL